MNNDAWGCYIHVPWCASRCPYCAFAITPCQTTPPWEPYAERITQGIARHAHRFSGKPCSVFFGGGTPSRLPGDAFRTLLQSLDVATDAEVSLEANPEDVNEAWLASVIDAGVQRVSLGVQTFDQDRAKVLGRAHLRADVERAVALLADAPLSSWSIDLIFALHGQDTAMFARDLARACDTGVPHVALYGLTVEPDTPFGRAAERGRKLAADTSTWRAMYDTAVATLRAYGFERYEVSNFAKDGHRCRHNVGYWSGRPYMGLGPSAHGFAPDGARWINHADLETWLTAPDTVATEERPDAQQAALDMLLTTMRGVEGLDLNALRSRTGGRIAKRTLTTLLAMGLVTYDPPAVRLTDDGFPVCDAVVSRLARDLTIH